MTRVSPIEYALVGDVGGTKVELAFVTGDPEVNENKKVIQRSYQSGEYTGLLPLIKEAIADVSNDVGKKRRLVIYQACLGVPGVVNDGKCQITNLPNWEVVDAEKLGREIYGEKNIEVGLLNDLEATAWGVLALRDKDVSVLNKGEAKVGNKVVVAPGTGLGVANIPCVDSGYGLDENQPSSSEGGHVDFAPRNELEWELLKYLLENPDYNGHVSYERIVSGPGIVNIYNFLQESGNYSPLPSELFDELQSSQDKSEVISKLGLSRKDKCCEDVLKIFVSVCGAFAGNMALSQLATGGVYVGGGIPPKILDAFHDRTFMQSFCNKGRGFFSKDLLPKIPVQVVLNPNTPIAGALNYLARSSPLSGFRVHDLLDAKKSEA